MNEQKDDSGKVPILIAESLLDLDIEQKLKHKDLALDLKDLDRLEYIRSDPNDTAVGDYEERWLKGEYQGDEDFGWMDELRQQDRENFGKSTYFCLIHYSRFT